MPFKRNALALLWVVLIGSAMQAEACIGPWQPASVVYRAPVPPSTDASLAFGPDVCSLAFSPGDGLPVVLTVVGANLTLQASLSDTVGVGPLTPAAPVEIPIPPLPAGEYQLQTAFDSPRVLDASLTLVVSAGVPTEIPTSSRGALLALALSLSLAAWAWMRR